jgi:hypothetical protein
MQMCCDFLLWRSAKTILKDQLLTKELCAFVSIQAPNDFGNRSVRIHLDAPLKKTCLRIRNYDLQIKKNNYSFVIFL